MAENYKHLYEQTKKMLTMYQDELIPGFRKKIEELEAKVATDNNVGSKWIPVTERLPTIYDADADNCVLAIHKASNKRYYHWRSVAYNPFDFTHWMKTPQPPKGE